MKIPLNLNLDPKERAEPGKYSEADIEACKRGDWEAKARIMNAFMPLISMLARKKGKDTSQINAMIEAGKSGILDAVREYKPSGDAKKFQVFALEFIERRMLGKKPGFWSSLFGS